MTQQTKALIRKPRKGIFSIGKSYLYSSLKNLTFVLVYFADSRGSFQLRTKEEVEKIKHDKEEMDKKRAQTAWLGGSILDRSTISSNGHNPNAIITLPPNYAIDTTPEKDTNRAPTIPAPGPFEVPYIQVNNGNARLSKHDQNDNENPARIQSLLVPDRVSIEYKGDEREVGGSSLKSPSGGFSVAAPSTAVSDGYPSVTILLSKKRTSLGWLYDISSCCAFNYCQGIRLYEQQRLVHQGGYHAKPTFA